MRKSEQQLIARGVRQVAAYMCAAAHTAPKAKGVNNLVTRVLWRPAEISRLCRWMRRVARREQKPGFSRDADNLAACAAVVVIGTRLGPLDISYCGLCGSRNCAALRRTSGRCAFNSIDLGIAAGSAVSVAAAFHIDNRIMYSAGLAAVALNVCRDRRVRLALAVPLAVTGKNLFFDRPPAR